MRLHLMADPRGEARLEQVLTHSPVVLYALPLLMDRPRLEWVSDSSACVMGYEPQHCLAPNWWQERIHPDDRATVLAQWPLVFHSERLVCEYRFRMANGRYRWLRDELRRLPADAPACVGAWTDITERRDAEQALTQWEAQFRGVVEESPQGVVVLQGGRIAYVNPACMRLFGHDKRADVLDEPWARFVSPEEVAQLQARIDACTRGVTLPMHPGWEGVRADGTRIWVESVGRPCLWDGKPALLSFLTDVTERRRRDLEALGRLAAGITHDFNNAFTVIKGYSEMLLASFAPADPRREMMAEVCRAGERAATVSRELLDLSSGTTTGAILEEPVAGHMAAAAHLGPETQTVLVVEDEDTVRSLIRQVLEDLGYRVIAANAAAEAVCLCERHSTPISLLITDVMLPQMAGPRLAEAARRIHPRIRVLYVSGDSDETVPRQGAGLERVNCLQKPFAATALACKVREVLECDVLERDVRDQTK